MEHDVGVPRAEGERRPEPDGGLAAAAEMHAVPAQGGEEPVPLLNVRQVHGDEGTAPANLWDKAGEVMLELVEARHHHVPWASDTVQKVVFLDCLHDLTTDIGVIVCKYIPFDVQLETRVAELGIIDPDRVDPDPTFEKNPDPTLEKNPAPVYFKLSRSVNLH